MRKPRTKKFERKRPSEIFECLGDMVIPVTTISLAVAGFAHSVFWTIIIFSIFVLIMASVCYCSMKYDFPDMDKVRPLYKV